MTTNSLNQSLLQFFEENFNFKTLAVSFPKKRFPFFDQTCIHYSFDSPLPTEENYRPMNPNVVSVEHGDVYPQNGIFMTIEGDVDWYAHSVEPDYPVSATKGTYRVQTNKMFVVSHPNQLSRYIVTATPFSPDQYSCQSFIKIVLETLEKDNYSKTNCFPFSEKGAWFFSKKTNRMIRTYRVEPSDPIVIRFAKCDTKEEKTEALLILLKTLYDDEMTQFESRHKRFHLDYATLYKNYDGIHFTSDAFKIRDAKPDCLRILEKIAIPSIILFRNVFRLISSEELEMD